MHEGEVGGSKVHDLVDIGWREIHQGPLFKKIQIRFNLF